MDANTEIRRLQRAWDSTAAKRASGVNQQMGSDADTAFRISGRCEDFQIIYLWGKGLPCCCIAALSSGILSQQENKDTKFVFAD